MSIEPNPVLAQEFDKRGFECLRYACCEEDKGQVNFSVSDNEVSWSSFTISQGLGPVRHPWPGVIFRTISVEALTLNTIMKRHYPKISSIDVLSIDTEGWELEVLAGFDLAKFSPKVVILEDLTLSLSRYSAHMEELGYKQVQQIVQDVFFVRKEEVA